MKHIHKYHLCKKCKFYVPLNEKHNCNIKCNFCKNIINPKENEENAIIEHLKNCSKFLDFKFEYYNIYDTLLLKSKLNTFFIKSNDINADYITTLFEKLKDEVIDLT